ncbi:MAG TPA: tyrosine-type recombinase/integrase [Oscillospiraceae bacterium]|nr:tyrosine-type recombinase/integrase [Oscillospiraceae bacterium]
MPLLKGLHSCKHERLCSRYTAAEIQRVMSSVDRSTKSGKTIYLMMLMACVYGLRVSDIRELQLSSLNWKNARIELFQCKTKRYIELPMTPDVRLALLDYLKYVRPDVKDTHVFIKFKGTPEPYSVNSHFADKISVFFKRAGIKIEGKHHGLHALRHSLASELSEQDVPVHEIAVILGHTSVAATKSYIWSDIAHLKIAALEVPSYDQQ